MDLQSIITALFQELAPSILIERLEIDRIHRSLTPRPEDGPPREIVIKLHYFHTRAVKGSISQQGILDLPMAPLPDIPRPFSTDPHQEKSHETPSTRPTTPPHRIPLELHLCHKLLPQKHLLCGQDRRTPPSHITRSPSVNP